MEPSRKPDDESPALLASFRSFCFPGGEDAARLVRGVKITQRGEFCMSPGARWSSFTAEERINATQSGFCWDARFGGSRLGSYVVTDAYEEGRGRLTIKLAGMLTVKKFAGPDLDKGEIQRYLSEILMCPSILLNHPSLEFTATGHRTLRLRDGRDSTGATVDFEFSDEGRPIACRAERPRLVGKRTVLTPWSEKCQEFEEWEGLRVARRVEACWHLPEGAFTYIRGEVTSYTVWQ